MMIEIEEKHTKVELCTFKMKLIQAMIPLKFPCCYFLEWRTLDGSQCSRTEKVYKSKDYLIDFEEELSLTTQMVYSLQKQQYLAKDTELMVGLVSETRPNQSKLIGKVIINLEQLIKTQNYAQNHITPLTSCSVEATVVYAVLFHSSHEIEVSASELDQSAFKQAVSQLSNKYLFQDDSCPLIQRYSSERQLVPKSSNQMAVKGHSKKSQPYIPLENSIVSQFSVAESREKDPQKNNTGKVEKCKLQKDLVRYKNKVKEQQKVTQQLKEDNTQIMELLAEAHEQIFAKEEQIRQLEIENTDKNELKIEMETILRQLQVRNQESSSKQTLIQSDNANNEIQASKAVSQIYCRLFSEQALPIPDIESPQSLLSFQVEKITSEILHLQNENQQLLNNTTILMETYTSINGNLESELSQQNQAFEQLESENQQLQSQYQQLHKDYQQITTINSKIVTVIQSAEKAINELEENLENRDQLIIDLQASIEEMESYIDQLQKQSHRGQEGKDYQVRAMSEQLQKCEERMRVDEEMLAIQMYDQQNLVRQLEQKNQVISNLEHHCMLLEIQVEKATQGLQDQKNQLIELQSTVKQLQDKIQIQKREELNNEWRRRMQRNKENYLNEINDVKINIELKKGQMEEIKRENQQLKSILLRDQNPLNEHVSNLELEIIRMEEDSFMHYSDLMLAQQQLSQLNQQIKTGRKKHSQREQKKLRRCSSVLTCSISTYLEKNSDSEMSLIKTENGSDQDFKVEAELIN